MRTHEGNSEPVPLAPGDRVWASTTGFLDADKPWAVGILCEILPFENGPTLYKVGPKLGHPWSDSPYFENCVRVSKSSAQRIIRTLRRARRKPLFDQIWEHLIEQRRPKKS